MPSPDVGRGSALLVPCCPVDWEAAVMAKLVRS
jgi:hypothetical protein